jgi:hypothetical protein
MGRLFDLYVDLAVAVVVRVSPLARSLFAALNTLDPEDV